MEPFFIKCEFEEIRGYFRDFYGSLPIVELVLNRELIARIELLETQLRRVIDENIYS